MFLYCLPAASLFITKQREQTAYLLWYLLFHTPPFFFFISKQSFRTIYPVNEKMHYFRLPTPFISVSKSRLFEIPYDIMISLAKENIFSPKLSFIRRFTKSTI
jgi:hypothetical protein